LAKSWEAGFVSSGLAVTSPRIWIMEIRKRVGIYDTVIR
jgi:hypothetical protein